MAEALDSPVFVDEEERECFYNLVKDLPGIKWSMTTAVDGRRLWVFWKNPTPPPKPCGFDIPFPNTAAAKIRDALHSLCIDDVWLHYYMVQFWAPIWIGSERFLATSDQPFVLCDPHEQFYSFRKKCVDYTFSVDGEEGGLLGRVFRNKRLESTPNVNCYSDGDYPLCQHAVNCCLVKHLAVPVLESSTLNCVGVLEFLRRDWGELKPLNPERFDRIGASLQTVDLIMGLHSACHLESIGLPSCFQFGDDKHSEMRNMLQKMMKGIRKVCLAQAWWARKHCSVECRAGILEKSHACHDNICLSVIPDMSVSYGPWWNCDMSEDRSDGILNQFSKVCCRHHLQKGQGLVGKAYLSRRPCFCRDISQFTSNEYPLVYYARHARLARSFVIGLHHTCFNNYYILELFFIPGDHVDPQYILGSIMTILQEFTSFEVAFGKESLHVEEIQPSMQMHQTMLGTSGNEGDHSLPSSASHQQGKVEMENASSGSDVVVVVNDSKRSNTVPSYPRDTQSIEASISHETLKQHFGTKLEDAADSLVSRSTLKRISRRHGILRWPSHKRSRANSKRHPLLPHLLPDKSVAPVDTAMDYANAITVKAKYRDDFLKFELPFSSGMVELKEQLSRRLELNTTAYKIRYLDEDGDPVLVTCDEDLQKYMSTCRSQVSVASSLVLRNLINLLCIIAHQLSYSGRAKFFP